MDKLKVLDRALFLKIYNFTKKHYHFKKLMIFISRYSPRFFSTIYFAAAVLLIYNQDSNLNLFILIPVLTYLSAKLIPYFYNRLRPYADLEIKALVQQRSDHSFPSTHSSSAVVISLAILRINFELGIIMIIVSLFTGFSRIAVGVHYPTDVLAGFLLALAFNLVLLFF